MPFPVHYPVMMHTEGLESTPEAGDALGYHLEQLLRCCCALQTSCMHQNLIVIKVGVLLVPLPNTSAQINFSAWRGVGQFP